MVLSCVRFCVCLCVHVTATKVEVFGETHQDVQSCVSVDGGAGGVLSRPPRELVNLGARLTAGRQASAVPGSRAVRRLMGYN